MVCKQMFRAPRLTSQGLVAQYGKKTCSTDCADAQQGKILSKQGRRKGPTKPEKILRRIVRAGFPCNKISYEWRVGTYSVDVFVHDLDLAYEADGVYWHTRPGVAAKDIRRDRDLKALGIETIRFTDTRLKSMDKRRRREKKAAEKERRKAYRVALQPLREDRDEH